MNPGKLHASVRKAIERMFVAGANGRGWEDTRAHIADCDECRAYYDRLASSLQARESGELSVDALERVGAAVMESAGRQGKRSSRAAALGAFAAAGLALAVLVLFLVRADTPVVRPDLTARGAGDARALVPGERNPGARIFCITPNHNGGRVLHEVRAVEPSLAAQVLSCTIDAELQLAYSVPGLEGLTMVAYSRDSDGLVRYYAPTTADAPALALTSDVIDEALAWSTRLGVRHHPGDYELYIGFYTAALTAGEAVRGASVPIYELRARMRIEPASMEGRQP